MNNKTLLTGFAIALLAYSGWRTWDYLSRYLLNDVAVTESVIIGAFFLVVTEIGYLFWLHKGQPDATTDLQETTATILIYIDLFGSLAIGLADLAVHNSMYNVDLTAIDPILFLMPWFLIASNLIGYTIYHGGDSERQLERATRQLKHEEIRFEIEARRQALDELNKNRQAMGAKLAPHYFKDIVDRVEGRTVNRFARQASKARNLENIELQSNPVASNNGDERNFEEVPIHDNGGKKAGNPSRR